LHSRLGAMTWLQKVEDVEASGAVVPRATRLRKFEAEPRKGKAGLTEWQQSLGSISLSCPIQASDGDITVEASTCELRVLAQGKKIAAMSGMLWGTIFPNLSWWRLRRDVAKRRTFGVDEAFERLTLEVELAKTAHKSWPEPWYSKAMKHPAARVGYPWTPAMEAAQDTQQRTELITLAQGPPQRSRFLEEGSSEKGSSFLFAPDDVCIGLDTLQDNETVTVRVHFEAEALQVVQRIMPLEELLAVDVLEDRVVIFFQGDEQNPVLWASLSGRCLPKATKWALTTCDKFRDRQRNHSAPGCALAVVLQKQQSHRGQWEQPFATCLQHPLMLKNYDELEELMEALRGDEEDRHRLTPEKRRECHQRLADWKEERFQGLDGAMLLPRSPEVGLALREKAEDA